jgi:hypothetical protein
MFAFLVLSTSPGYEVKPLAIGLLAAEQCASVYLQQLPGDVSRVAGGKEEQAAGDVVGRSRATEQCAIDKPLVTPRSFDRRRTPSLRYSLGRRR